MEKNRPHLEKIGGKVRKVAYLPDFEYPCREYNATVHISEDFPDTGIVISHYGGENDLWLIKVESYVGRSPFGRDVFDTIFSGSFHFGPGLKIELVKQTILGVCQTFSDVTHGPEILFGKIDEQPEN